MSKILDLIELNKERWIAWNLLEYGDFIDSSDRYLSYIKNIGEFKSDKSYFGCGHDIKLDKYYDWDMSDVRHTPGVIVWDILLGMPYLDSTLSKVKSKLSIGMFTINQLKFVMREAARCLSVGGEFELTFRDFDSLLARRDELDYQLFVRYIYGSGLYFGSRRKSCWTVEAVTELAEKYNLAIKSVSSRGMNSTLNLTRIEGNLKKFGPEPKVKFNEDGSMFNDGGEFDF